MSTNNGLKIAGGPEANPLPRQVKKLKPKQNLFVHHYVETLDPGKAYAVAYGVKDRKVATSAGNRLLRNVAVLAAIEKLQMETMERLGWNAVEVVQRFHVVYLKALEAGDHAAALSCLDRIGRHLGIYEAHNQQRVYSQNDYEALKAELETLGVSFKRVAYLNGDAERKSLPAVSSTAAPPSSEN